MKKVSSSTDLIIRRWGKYPTRWRPKQRVLPFKGTEKIYKRKSNKVAVESGSYNRALNCKKTDKAFGYRVGKIFKKGKWFYYYRYGKVGWQFYSK